MNTPPIVPEPTPPDERNELASEADVEEVKSRLELARDQLSEFIEKAEQVNGADYDAQDDDNPTEPTYGEECVRAERVLGETQEALEAMDKLPKEVSEDLLQEFEAQTKSIEDDISDIGVLKLIGPDEDDGDEDEDDAS